MERIFDDVRVVQFTNVSYMGGPFSLTAGSKGKKVFKQADRNAKKSHKEAGIKTDWYSPRISALPYPEFQKRLETDKYGEEIVMDIELAGARVPSLKQVKTWSRETCQAINMKAFGRPMVSDVRFGEGDTLVQYIETSAINYRRYGKTGCANCFTCASLPVEDAVGFSLADFGARGAVCWHLPRGSFADIKRIRRNTKIFKAGLSPSKSMAVKSKVYKPRFLESAEVFSPAFKLPLEQGFSSAFELIMDIYDCDYSMISSCQAVAEWAAEGFSKITGLEPVGNAEAPDFGHAKKKTAGPSVTQLLANGSNISHYSMNWLMFVVNVVSEKRFPLRRAIEYTMDYFQGKYAVCWILPRGISRQNIKDIADHTYIFSVEKK
jgi:hypothetical protein